jgi:hypothetical protein
MGGGIPDLASDLRRLALSWADTWDSVTHVYAVTASESGAIVESSFERSKTRLFRLVWNGVRIPPDLRVSLPYARPRVQLYPLPHSLLSSLTFPDRL